MHNRKIRYKKYNKTYGKVGVPADGAVVLSLGLVQHNADPAACGEGRVAAVRHRARHALGRHAHSLPHADRLLRGGHLYKHFHRVSGSGDWSYTVGDLTPPYMSFNTSKAALAGY